MEEAILKKTLETPTEGVNTNNTQATPVSIENQNTIVPPPQQPVSTSHNRIATLLNIKPEDVNKPPAKLFADRENVEASENRPLPNIKAIKLKRLIEDHHIDEDSWSGISQNIEEIEQVAKANHIKLSVTTSMKKLQPVRNPLRNSKENAPTSRGDKADSEVKDPKPSRNNFLPSQKDDSKS
jgi:hypothetical protein